MNVQTYEYIYGKVGDGIEPENVVETVNSLIKKILPIGDTPIQKFVYVYEEVNKNIKLPKLSLSPAYDPDIKDFFFRHLRDEVQIMYLKIIIDSDELFNNYVRLSVNDGKKILKFVIFDEIEKLKMDCSVDYPISVVVNVNKKAELRISDYSFVEYIGTKELKNEMTVYWSDLITLKTIYNDQIQKNNYYIDKIKDCINNFLVSLRIDEPFYTVCDIFYDIVIYLAYVVKNMNMNEGKFIEYIKETFEKMGPFGNADNYSYLKIIWEKILDANGEIAIVSIANNVIYEHKNNNRNILKISIYAVGESIFNICKKKININHVMHHRKILKIEEPIPKYAEYNYDKILVK